MGTGCFSGTGFTEAVLEERSVTLKNHVIPQPRVNFEINTLYGLIFINFELSIAFMDLIHEISVDVPHR